MQLESLDIAACAATIESFFGELFEDLERMRERLTEQFTAGPVSSSLAGTVIEPLARVILEREEIVGTGFVASPDALSDQHLYLAWWQGENQQLLAESAAPASGDPLDYTRHEWFRTPLRTRRRHITGPYVDFVCTDEYVVTSTMPVLVGEAMVGVVGADTLVETLETMLLPKLRQAGDRATLVNHIGRAVASADPHTPTGTLVDLTNVSEFLPCRGLPLSVVVPA
ncbi:MAG: cache domain-containing protein [Aeromicrobium sp.]